MFEKLYKKLISDLSEYFDERIKIYYPEIIEEGVVIIPYHIQEDPSLRDQPFASAEPREPERTLRHIHIDLLIVSYSHDSHVIEKIIRHFGESPQLEIDSSISVQIVPTPLNIEEISDIYRMSQLRLGQHIAYKANLSI